MKPNASTQPRREAGAQRTLYGVGCSAMIMIEASPAAYHDGMLALGKQQQLKEEKTFYVAVLVKLFLSSPGSDGVFFPLKDLRLRRCDLC